MLPGDQVLLAVIIGEHGGIGTLEGNAVKDLVMRRW
jgi:hypothetical protein